MVGAIKNPSRHESETSLASRDKQLIMHHQIPSQDYLMDSPNVGVGENDFTAQSALSLPTTKSLMKDFFIRLEAHKERNTRVGT